jgi:cell division protease FtsH
VKLAGDIDLDAIAGATPGFTGADLANLVNEAAIIATRRNAATVAGGDFIQAIERTVAGLEKKSRVLSKEERRRVAYHEMGHALVAASLPGVDPILKVSIIPLGVGALGYTMQRPTEDRFLLARSDLENRIAVLTGGRAAESLIFDGDISTGAADDLQRATEVALEMVTRHGMDDIVGQRTYMAAPQPFLAAPSYADRVQASEATAREIDLAVRDAVAHAFSRAVDILKSRRADLEDGAELLLSRESLTAKDFPALHSTAGGSSGDRAMGGETGPRRRRGRLDGKPASLGTRGPAAGGHCDRSMKPARFGSRYDGALAAGRLRRTVITRAAEPAARK